MPFHGLFVMFGLFIVACGFSHLLDSIMFQLPVYRLFGLVKLITAIVSWTTVIAMIPVVPRALDLIWDQELRVLPPTRMVSESRRSPLLPALKRAIAGTSSRSRRP